MSELVAFWKRLFRSVERGSRRMLATPYPSIGDLRDAQRGRMPRGPRP